MRRKPGHIDGDISEAGYVRIRKYVVDKIIHGEKKPQRLASMRELAAEFGVGCTTVQKALKDLAADGLLTVKVGVGMFTNPQRGRRQEPPQIIELLTADGQQIYFEHYLCAMSSAAATAVTAAGYFLHHLDLFQTNQGVRSEIGEHSRGLVWVVPEMASGARADEFVRSLAIPRVVIAGRVEGLDCVDYDREREGYEVTCRLLEEGRSKIMVLANLARPFPQLSGIRRAFRERNLEFDERLVLDHNRDIVREFCDAIDAFGNPQAIYDVAGGPVLLWNAMRERKFDLVNGCRLVMADDRPSELPCRMLRNDYTKLAANGLELLQRRIAQAQLPPETRLFRRECYDYYPQK